MSCKQKRKKGYLECLVACLCFSTTKILNIPYQSIYFMDGFNLLPLSCYMVTKDSTHTILQLKVAGLFKFVLHFGTCRERVIKILVHGYPLGPVRNYQK